MFLSKLKHLLQIHINLVDENECKRFLYDAEPEHASFHK